MLISANIVECVDLAANMRLEVQFGTNRGYEETSETMLNACLGEHLAVSLMTHVHCDNIMQWYIRDLPHQIKVWHGI